MEKPFGRSLEDLPTIVTNYWLSGMILQVLPWNLTWNLKFKSSKPPSTWICASDLGKKSFWGVKNPLAVQLVTNLILEVRWKLVIHFRVANQSSPRSMFVDEKKNPVTNKTHICSMGLAYRSLHDHHKFKPTKNRIHRDRIHRRIHIPIFHGMWVEKSQQTLPSPPQNSAPIFGTVATWGVGLIPGTLGPERLVVLNQPILKNMRPSNWVISPIFGVKIENFETTT